VSGQIADMSAKSLYLATDPVELVLLRELSKLLASAFHPSRDVPSQVSPLNRLDWHRSEDTVQKGAFR
jgi:hypothetical protein